MKKILILLLGIVLALILLPSLCLAEDGDEFIISGGTRGTDYTYENGVLTFVKGGEYTISMVPGVSKTAHWIKTDMTGVYNSTKKIKLTLSGLNIERNEDQCIFFYESTAISSNIGIEIVVDGENTIKNTKSSGHCLRLNRGVADTIFSGSGTLTLNSANGSSSYDTCSIIMNAPGLTIDSTNVQLCTVYGSGLFELDAGTIKVKCSNQACIYSTGEIYMTGGTLDLTATGDHSCITLENPQDRRKGAGFEITGGTVNLEATGSGSTGLLTLTTSKEKNLKITGGTVSINGNGKRPGGILLFKEGNNYIIEGGTVSVTNCQTGIFCGNAACSLTFNGGETELDSTAYALYHVKKSPSFGSNYQHKVYVGNSPTAYTTLEQHVSNGGSLLNDTGNSPKYVLITPAYPITYNLNGGSLPDGTSNPANYTRLDTFTLNNPSLWHHNFVGWTGSNGDTPELTLTVPKGSKGAKQYIANLQPDSYTIIFHANNGTDATATQAFSYGMGQALDPNPFTYDSHDFLWWNTLQNPTADNPGKAYDDKEVVESLNGENGGEVHFYAQWKAWAADAPVITSQPQDLTLTEGYGPDNTLTVAADTPDGTALSYQWYSNTSASNTGGTPISGATDSAYTVPTGLTAGEKMYYYCVVTATRTDNGETAEAVSNAAAVTVQEKGGNETKYTITWKNEDGTVLKTDQVKEGEMPAYTGMTPEKQGNGQVNYKFSGWTPEVVPAAGDAVYTAVFTETTQHVHKIGRQEKTNEKEATCSESGGYTLLVYCKECGELMAQYQALIPPKCHHWRLFDAVEPTCTEPGSTEEERCTLCGTVLTPAAVIPPLGHDIVAAEAVEPTCEQPGHTAGEHCARCGLVLSGEEEIPALGHDIVSTEAVEPTCEQPGHTAGQHCARCGKVLSGEEELAALKHEYVLDEAVDPTCEQPGHTIGLHCGRCRQVLVTPRELPALGHIPTSDEAVEPTYDYPGRTAGSYCQRCGTVLSGMEEIPALEVIPGDVNMDGKVDGRDVLRLARFLAGHDVKISYKASDVTGDGNVDGRDLLRLARYLAGHDVKLGK